LIVFFRKNFSTADNLGNYVFFPYDGVQGVLCNCSTTDGLDQRVVSTTSGGFDHDDGEASDVGDKSVY
jgi:hypothetical protein